MRTPTLDLLSRAMKAYQWRMQAVTSNIANVDTPGYRRLTVTFEESLQAARQGADAEEAQQQTDPVMAMQDGPPMLEDELMDLADTQMRSQLATRALREQFELLRTGVTGRSG